MFYGVVLQSLTPVHVPGFPFRVTARIQITSLPFSPQGCPLNNRAIGSLLIEVGKVSGSVVFVWAGLSHL